MVVVPDFTVYMVYDTLESLHVAYGWSGFFLLFRAIILIWGGSLVGLRYEGTIDK